MVKIYETPQLLVYDLELQGYVCTSIMEMTFYEEIDEYVNCGEEDLNFNSDY